MKHSYLLVLGLTVGFTAFADFSNPVETVRQAKALKSCTDAAGKEYKEGDSGYSSCLKQVGVEAAKKVKKEIQDSNNAPKLPTQAE